MRDPKRTGVLGLRIQNECFTGRDDLSAICYSRRFDDPSNSLNQLPHIFSIAFFLKNDQYFL